MALLLRAELLACFFSHYREQWVRLGPSFDGPRFDPARSAVRFAACKPASTERSWERDQGHAPHRDPCAAAPSVRHGRLLSLIVIGVLLMAFLISMTPLSLLFVVVRTMLLP